MIRFQCSFYKLRKVSRQHLENRYLFGSAFERKEGRGSKEGAAALEF